LVFVLPLFALSLGATDITPIHYPGPVFDYHETCDISGNCWFGNNLTSDVSGLTLLGSAQLSVASIMLTPDETWQYGTVAYNTPLDLAGDTFSMSASFSINSSGTPADGLVFRFQPNLNETGPLGGALGIFGQPGFFVVLDTFTNTAYGDLASPSVAVIGCGVGKGADPNHYDGCTPAMAPVGFSVVDGALHTLNISYGGGQLGVSVDGSTIIDTPLVLANYLSGPVYTEVSGVTGGLSEAATLSRWDLYVAPAASTPEPCETAVVGLVLLAIGGRLRLRRGK
jgi:hypothetical protein